MTHTALVHIDALTAFGLLAVSLMVSFYALESQSHHFTLAFAGACVMGSAYGFLQGAWPIGLVEGIWSMLAVRRWALLRTTRKPDDVDRFMADLLMLTREVEPMIFAFLNDVGALRGYVQIYRPGRGRVLIQRLWAVVPHQRHGSFMLRTLCHLADRHSVRLRLKAH